MGLLDRRSKLRLFKAIIASIILCIPIQLVEDSMYLRDEIFQLKAERGKKELAFAVELALCLLQNESLTCSNSAFPDLLSLILFWPLMKMVIKLCSLNLM